jgi:FixJ family two-component response regulator
VPGTAEIAVVDDDESVRQAVDNLLRSLGYAVRSFAGGEEFLQSQLRRRVSCLISDMQMPAMSGIDIQAALALRGDPTPVIFITAFPSDAVKARALKAGAIGFLAKPFDGNALIACVEQALRGQAPAP